MKNHTRILNLVFATLATIGIGSMISCSSLTTVQSGTVFSDSERDRAHVREAALGSQSYQYTYERLRKVRSIRTGGGKHPIIEYVDKVTGEKVWVKGGPEHTLRAEFAGQRIFKAMGLAVPKTSLLIDQNGKVELAMEYLEGYSLGIPSALDEKAKLDLVVGYIGDVLIHNYDRNSGNLMYKGKDVMFIDEGASFTSKAQGGTIQFPITVDVRQFLKIVSGPGKSMKSRVNNFYPKIIHQNEAIDGKLVFNDEFKAQLAIAKHRLAQISDAKIDAIMAVAFGDLDISQAKASLESRRNKLTKKSKFARSPVLVDAAQTLQDIIEQDDGDQAKYFARALKHRRDSIISLIP